MVTNWINRIIHAELKGKQGFPNADIILANGFNLSEYILTRGQFLGLDALYALEESINSLLVGKRYLASDDKEYLKVAKVAINRQKVGLEFHILRLNHLTSESRGLLADFAEEFGYGEAYVEYESRLLIGDLCNHFNPGSGYGYLYGITDEDLVVKLATYLGLKEDELRVMAEAMYEATVNSDLKAIYHIPHFNGDIQWVNRGLYKLSDEYPFIFDFDNSGITSIISGIQEFKRFYRRGGDQFHDIYN